jgi:predicted MarR family transcription regulator
MIQALEADDLVQRDPGTGREVSVTLTDTGRDAATRLLDARTASLTRLLAQFSRPEQRELTELLSDLLSGLYGEIGSSELLCRLCDRDSCTRGAVCPVGQAERERDWPT